MNTRNTQWRVSSISEHENTRKSSRITCRIRPSSPKRCAWFLSTGKSRSVKIYPTVKVLTAIKFLDARKFPAHAWVALPVGPLHWPLPLQEKCQKREHAAAWSMCDSSCLEILRKFFKKSSNFKKPKTARCCPGTVNMTLKYILMTSA